MVLFHSKANGLWYFYPVFLQVGFRRAQLRTMMVSYRWSPHPGILQCPRSMPFLYSLQKNSPPSILYTFSVYSSRIRSLALSEINLKNVSFFSTLNNEEIPLILLYFPRFFSVKSKTTQVSQSHFWPSSRQSGTYDTFSKRIFKAFLNPNTTQFH